MRLRAAVAGDAGFLAEMLVAAANWTGDRPIGREEVEADAQLARYVRGWPRPDDFGVIAIEDGGWPIGAAWARTFSPDEPGYGFVAAGVPEVSMAVVGAHRGEGIGRRLLVALIEDARRRGWTRLSLSVERANRATGLYRDVGFAVVASRDDSDTMALDL